VLHGTFVLVTMGSERKTRRRGEALSEAILDAALQELAESGWSSFSLAAVAARAGTGNGSVYSRWPTKTSLIRAATDRLAQMAPEPAGFSGELEKDLLLIARATAASLAGPGGAGLRAFVAEQDADTRGAEKPSIFDDSAPVRAVVEIVARAEEAGELPPRRRPARVLNLGLTVIGHHFLLNGVPPDDDALGAIVNELWLPLLQV
jgi:AcrR family transcriptional regulator